MISTRFYFYKIYECNKECSSFFNNLIANVTLKFCFLINLKFFLMLNYQIVTLLKLFVISWESVIFFFFSFILWELWKLTSLFRFIAKRHLLRNISIYPFKIVDRFSFITSDQDFSRVIIYFHGHAHYRSLCF